LQLGAAIYFGEHINGGMLYWIRRGANVRAYRPKRRAAAPEVPEQVKAGGVVEALELAR
jgi:hypothetical protein